MYNVINMYAMSICRVLRVQIMVNKFLVVLLVWLIYFIGILVTIEIIWVLLTSIIILLSSSRFVNIFTIAQFKKLKCLSILFSDIVNSSKTVEIINKMQHLFICLIIVVWYDRNSIIDLESETIYTVIDDDHIFQVSVPKNSQIFDVIPFLS